jgi:hypothetical protein
MSKTSGDERMRILEQIERGEISAAEGMQKLEQLAAESPVVERVDPVMAAADAPSPTDPDIARWKRWWTLPFAIGIGIISLSGLLMLSAIQASGYGFWFFCLWAPFMAGVAAMALAWASRTSRWLHLRVHTGHADAEWPRKISVSFPIPMRLTAWLLRTFGPSVPQLRNTALDELILALNDNTSESRPLYVDVTDGDKGERMQVFIG